MTYLFFNAHFFFIGVILAIKVLRATKTRVRGKHAVETECASQQQKPIFTASANKDFQERRVKNV